MLRHDLSVEEPLSWPLRLAHRVALTLIAISTVLLLVVLLKEGLIDRPARLAPSIESDSSLSCSPIESDCPMLRSRP